VEERHPGISVVTGGMLPMQIIEAKALEEEENRWLVNLCRDLSRGSVLKK